MIYIVQTYKYFSIPKFPDGILNDPRHQRIICLTKEVFQLIIFLVNFPNFSSEWNIGILIFYPTLHVTHGIIACIPGGGVTAPPSCASWGRKWTSVKCFGQGEHVHSCYHQGEEKLFSFIQPFCCCVNRYSIRV